MVINHIKCLTLLPLLAILLFPFSTTAKTSDSLYVELTYPQVGRPFLSKKLPSVATVAPKRPATGFYRGNCVLTLKRAGLLPQGRVTLNGYASTIPIKPLDLKDGERAVVRTTEGRGTGHVVYVEKRGDQYFSLIEGGYPGGVGRSVPSSVIQGQVSL